jgi:hypothetical protein
MFDIVAPNEDQAAAAIDGCTIDDGQSRLASATGSTRQTFTAEPTHQIGGAPDKAEHDNERDEESHG